MKQSDHPLMKLPLGGPAWLRALAEEKAEMNHVLRSDDPETRLLNEREALGLRDAAERTERLEAALERALRILGGGFSKAHRDHIISEARKALEY